MQHANTRGWGSGVPGHPALGVVPIVAGALTLVAAVFLIVAALAGPRRAGRHAYTAVPLALGVALVGWVVLLVATRTEPAGLPARLTRTGLAVLVGYLPALLLALLAYSAIRGRIGARGRADVVVVLGSRLVGGRVPPILASRLDRAAALRVRCGDVPILVSGGSPGGGPRAEADAMADHLRGRGVPAEAILSERTSRDTAANLTNSHRVMVSRDAGYRCTVITSDFHVLRVGLIAHRVGVRGRVIGVASGWPDLASGVLREFVLLLAEYRWVVTAGCLLVLAAVLIPVAA